MSKPKGNVTSVGIGVCGAHKNPKVVSVTWPAGEPTVLSEGAPTLTLGTVGVCSCGHPATALTSSATVFEGGVPSHRVGDVGLTGAGTYSILTGAFTVFSGD